MQSTFSAGFLLSLAIVDVILASVTLCCNGLLLLVIYRDPRCSLRTPAVYLVASLSCSDIVTAFFTGYGKALMELHMYFGSVSPDAVRIVLDFGGCIGLLTALGTVLIVAIDRYIAITDALHYKSRITTRRIGVSIAVGWLSALVPATIYSLVREYTRTLLLVCSHTYFTLPVILIIVIYCKIFNSLSRRRRELASLSWAVSNITWRHLERERRMAVVAFMVVVLFCVSFLPFYLKIQLMNFCACTQSPHYQNFNFISHNFLYFSTLLDPVLYAWRIPKFRVALRDCWRLCKGSSVGPQLGLRSSATAGQLHEPSKTSEV